MKLTHEQKYVLINILASDETDKAPMEALMQTYYENAYSFFEEHSDEELADMAEGLFI